MLQSAKRQALTALSGSDNGARHDMLAAGIVKASAVTRSGARAIATRNWSVAAARCYDDSEKILLEEVLAVVGQIVHSVDLPVCVGLEGGYAAASSVHRPLAIGVIGLTFEGRMVGACGLYAARTNASELVATREPAQAFI